MEIKIHRGNQIGGCVTEISTATTKIVIDFGEELEHSGAELDIKQILDGCSAVFFSHYHGDHIGMYNEIPNDIPAYIGDLSKKMLLVLAKHAKKDEADKAQLENFKTYKIANKIQIGDISITPYLVDHSAIDAHMFVVEAGGEKILYTGDFRAHGFRGSKLPAVLKKYVVKDKYVDKLIIEGTTLSCPEKSCQTEHDLQKDEKKLIASKKYVFVLCSSMNIDRIGSFCKATPHSKYFLCDEYQKEMLDVVTTELAKKMKNSKTPPLYDFNTARIYKHGEIYENARRAKGFVMLVRTNDYLRKIIDQYPPEERLVIYSVWKGYADDPKKYPKYAKFLDGLDYKELHTSGHADAAAIKNLVSIVKPKKIYPIHTKNAPWFKENFPDIEVITQNKEM